MKMLLEVLLMYFFTFKDPSRSFKPSPINLNRFVRRLIRCILCLAFAWCYVLSGLMRVSTSSSGRKWAIKCLKCKKVTLLFLRKVSHLHVLNSSPQYHPTTITHQQIHILIHSACSCVCSRWKCSNKV